MSNAMWLQQTHCISWHEVIKMIERHEQGIQLSCFDFWGMGMMAAMPGMMMPGGFGYDMMGMSAMAGMAGMGTFGLFRLKMVCVKR